SVAALSEILIRYERGNARDVLRALTTRRVQPELPQEEPVTAAALTSPEPSAPVFAVTDSSISAVEFVPDVFYRPVISPPLPPPPSRHSCVAIGAAAASISFSASYVLVSHLHLRQPAVTTVATTSASE